MKQENSDWYAQIHRGYDFVPPGGESLEMDENRVIRFWNNSQSGLIKTHAMWRFLAMTIQCDLLEGFLKT
jgi:hypothetical protein